MEKELGTVLKAIFFSGLEFWKRRFEMGSQGIKLRISTVCLFGGDY